jgi:hypothetical protein
MWSYSYFKRIIREENNAGNAADFLVVIVVILVVVLPMLLVVVLVIIGFWNKKRKGLKGLMYVATARFAGVPS